MTIKNLKLLCLTSFIENAYTLKFETGLLTSIDFYPIKQL